MSIGLPGNSASLEGLGIEISKMANELNSITLPLQALKQQFEKALAPRGSSPGPPSADVNSLAAKVAYIAVLQSEIERATQNHHFNVLTAINDLWIKLDSVRNLAGTKPQSDSPSIDVEMMKLKRMIDKRSHMFEMIRQILHQQDETAKNVIQSMGR